MSKVIGIMGEPGSGKTTSMKNLDPNTTFYIDCDKKGLSWPKWRESYNAEKMNYLKNDFVQNVQRTIEIVSTSEDYKHIKTIVIDTINSLMVADEKRRRKEKGYDKWSDLAWSVWELIDSLYDYRDDLTIIVICHSQTQKEDDGYTFTRIKTSGKKLDKLSIESKLTTVLYSVASGGRYVFKTHADNSTTKTPLGAFKEDEIDNDIVTVLNALADY